MVAVVALAGFAIAGFVQLRTAKIKAGQEDDLRQLVHRYEHLAETTLDAQQRAASDVAEMRSRTASIEQILAPSSESVPPTDSAAGHQATGID